jgi:hypothetical protein
MFIPIIKNYTRGVIVTFSNATIYSMIECGVSNIPSIDTIAINYVASLLWPIYLPALAICGKGSEEKTAKVCIFLLWTMIIVWP